LLGDQHPGVGGFPVVVAPTFVYAIELQEPLVTGRAIAPAQVLFAGWANDEKLTNAIKAIRIKLLFFIIKSVENYF
jgi:hypothetical protein